MKGTAMATGTVNVVNVQGADAHYTRAQLEFAMGDYERAIADLTETLKINDNDPEAYYHRGRAKFPQRNYLSAIDDYTQAIKLNPTYAEAFRHRANAPDH